MKTRKIKKRKGKKGGVFGIRSLKTKSDNKTNCHRLAENFKSKSDFLFNKYQCASKNTPECKRIQEHVGLNKFCVDDKYIDNYDFSRDGLHVKNRTESFYDLQTIPTNVDGYPWKNMPDFFKENSGNYELKSETEML
jgi:hypothetical protein